MDWPQFFDWILVDSDASEPVYVATDGTVATVGGQGLDVVEPGQIALFSNRTLKLVPAQSAPGQTSVSIITAGSGSVTVWPQ